jgi:hypothetical protein
VVGLVGVEPTSLGYEPNMLPLHHRPSNCIFLKQDKDVFKVIVVLTYC